MSEERIVYLGLGANVGDPIAQCEWAIESLSTIPEITVLARSSLYQTSPVGIIEQPDFINAVVKLRTTLSPRECLAHSLQLETQQARVRDQRWGPRTLDCDILWMQGVDMDAPGLRLPHPRMQERLFVLIPLAEIEPQFHLPSGEWITDRIRTLQDTCHDRVKQLATTPSN